MKDTGGEKGACGQLNRIQVNYFPPLSDLLGISKEASCIPYGALIADLISLLGKQYGDVFVNLFFNEDRWEPKIGIFIDGRPAQNKEAVIPPAAEISLLPILSGG